MRTLALPCMRAKGAWAVTVGTCNPETFYIGRDMKSVEKKWGMIHGWHCISLRLASHSGVSPALSSSVLRKTCASSQPQPEVHWSPGHHALRCIMSLTAVKTLQGWAYKWSASCCQVWELHDECNKTKVRLCVHLVRNIWPPKSNSERNCNKCDPDKPNR